MTIKRLMAGFIGGSLLAFIPLAVGRCVYGELTFAEWTVVNPVIWVLSGIGTIVLLASTVLAKIKEED